VAAIEKLADACTANKSSSVIKKAIVTGIPCQAVLKPSHAVYHLQNQRFALGDSYHGPRFWRRPSFRERRYDRS
jgi:hypothetical protein